jgi:hypothetical protein
MVLTQIHLAVGRDSKRTAAVLSAAHHHCTVQHQGRHKHSSHYANASLAMSLSATSQGPPPSQLQRQHAEPVTQLPGATMPPVQGTASLPPCCDVSKAFD